MAKVVSGPLKGMRGKLGSVVLRNINGETYVCKRPIYKKTKDPGVLARRKRFALNIRLSKSVFGIPELKEFWRRGLSGKMSVHNAIVKANYAKVGDDEIAGVPMLTPGSISYTNTDIGFLYEDGSFSVEFNPDMYGMNCKGEKYVKAVGVVFMNGKRSYDAKEYEIFSVESDTEKLRKGEEAVLLMQFDDYHYDMMEWYSKGKMYFGFVVVDKDGSVLKEVSTFVMGLWGERFKSNSEF